MSDWAGIAWLVVLLLVNAFFVAAEFAVISARRSQVEPLAEEGRFGAKTSLYAMENATMMLATSQLGITVASLLILNVSEPAIHDLLHIPLALTGWSAGVIDVIAFIVTLLLVSYLHVVIGEMVPKNISFSVPTRAVLVLAPPLVFFSRVFKPIIIALNATANGVLLLFRVQPRTEASTTFSVDEVANIVAESAKAGAFGQDDGRLNEQLSAAFEFTDKKVRNITIPMSQLVTLEADATPADVEAAVRESGFSRYVLVSATGEPEGYLHLKDVIDLEDTDEFEAPVPDELVRPLMSLGEDLDLEDALAKMRGAHGGHLARVERADHSTAGIVFLEDIIEELVGEIQDATRRD